jgi:hypothetical protein
MEAARVRTSMGLAGAHLLEQAAIDLRSVGSGLADDPAHQPLTP